MSDDETIEALEAELDACHAELKALRELLAVTKVKMNRLHDIIWQGNDPYTMSLLNEAINTPIKGTDKEE